MLLLLLFVSWCVAFSVLQSAVVNVTIGAGSRAEDEDTEGISHTLQRAALKSTESRSHLRVVR